MKAIRVLVVDDHPSVREGHRAILESHEGIKVVAAVDNIDEAVQLVGQLHPDVVVTDLCFGRLEKARGGIDLIRRIRSQDQDIPIIVETGFCLFDDLRAASEAGATRYLLKEEPPERLVTAVRDALGSNPPTLDEDLVRIDQQKRYGNERFGARLSLTTREIEVLRCLARGISNKEIADAMPSSPITGNKIKEGTVKIHVQEILKKLGQLARLEELGKLPELEALVRLQQLGRLNAREHTQKLENLRQFQEVQPKPLGRHQAHLFAETLGLL